jgi:hypothetical protein
MIVSSGTPLTDTTMRRIPLLTTILTKKKLSLKKATEWNLFLIIAQKGIFKKDNKYYSVILYVKHFIIYKIYLQIKMKSTKLIILISLALLNFSMSNQNCESTNPTTQTDCYNRVTLTDNKCCYLSGLGTYSNQRMCLNVPISSFSGEKQIEYEGKAWAISCNTGSNDNYSILERCVNFESMSLNGCSTASSFTESCCFYDKPSVVSSTNQKVLNTPTGCYKLGTKYFGTINWAGLKLECNTKFIQSSIYLIFVSLLFVIFI